MGCTFTIKLHFTKAEQSPLPLNINLFRDVTILPTLKDVQQILIDEALCRTNPNQSAAASLIGITRQALNQRLNRS